MHRVAIRIALIVFSVCFSHASQAFLGAFWLGVDAKVETTVKVDQRALDTINNLPIEIRKQAVIAANEVFDRLDQSIKDNAKLLGAEIERTSLQAAIQWECTAKKVVDKAFSELRDLLPRWKIFPDKCERRYSPDKAGPGPSEKVKIAACWINDGLSESASPEVISTKMVTLQKMSAEAACSLRETQAASELWKDSAEYGLKYRTWLELMPVCANARECYRRRQDTVSKLTVAADKRDLGDAISRVERSKLNAEKSSCGRSCFEESLVELFLGEQEIKRNRRQRENEALSLANQAATYIASARTAATQANNLALKAATLQQYREQASTAEGSLRNANDSAALARKTSDSVEVKLRLIDAGAKEVADVLTKAAGAADRTLDAEIARQDRERKEAEEKARRNLHERCGGPGRVCDRN